MEESLRFPYSVREFAKLKADYRCTRCGGEVHDLEVHHIVPKWFGLMFLPITVYPFLNRIINAEVLCHHCHAQLHKHEKPSDYVPLAQALFKTDVQVVPNPSYPKRQAITLRQKTRPGRERRFFEKTRYSFEPDQVSPTLGVMANFTVRSR